MQLARDHLWSDIAFRVRTGQWERVCHGAYLPADLGFDAKDRALARIVAIHERLSGPHWFSHESAAMIWGLPVWRVPDVTHVRSSCRPGANRDRGIQRHSGAIGPDRLTRVGSLPVTDLVQTMVDCARSAPPLDALVVADAALRAGGDLDRALALLARAAGGAGVTRARAVLAVADGGAESAPESATRFLLLRAGLPTPTMQVEIRTRLGTFWVDVALSQWRLGLEYDGRVKYTDREALVAEKRRHDAIVEAGWQVLRVTQEDLWRPDQIVARVRAHLPQDVPVTARPALRAEPVRRSRSGAGHRPVSGGRPGLLR